MAKALEDKLFEHLAERPRPADDDIRFEPAQRRVRGVAGGVKVAGGGVGVAETDRPRLLFETVPRTRYYIPKLDARLDLLTPTSTVTRCPYKGEASYWSVNVNGKEFTDIGWAYPAPIPECPKIENLLCFFDEKVDGVYVDGELQTKPVTPWS